VRQEAVGEAVLGLHGVKAVYVDGQVEIAARQRSGRGAQLDGLADAEGDRHACLAGFPPGFADGQPGDVRPRHLEATLRKMDGVGARSAADVQSTAQLNLAAFDECDHLWRRNASVPPGPTEEIG
jgi:hypothetical protein